MTKLLRYSDLQEMGIFGSRMGLKRAIDTLRFPAGCLVTPNARRWAEAEVNEWLAARPVTRKAATNKGRRKTADASVHGEAY